MKFFVPDRSPEDAEQFYEVARRFAADSSGRIAEKRIGSISFRDKGKDVCATVGSLDPCEGRMVTAILGPIAQDSPYLICLRGRGGQMMVGKDEVRHVEEFDSHFTEPAQKMRGTRTILRLALGIVSANL